MITNGADFARAVAVVLDRKCDCGIFRSVRDFRLRRAVRKLATEEVRALLEAGVAPDQHPSMMPILALAAESGAAEIVELLLDHGADPAQISNEGWSAATWADANDFTALAERLIARGAPADSRFAHGYSALHRAARRGEVTAVLGGEAVDALDSSGDTPLSHAVRLRHEAAAEALLRAGANPNHSRDGWPLINEAAYQDSRPDEPTRFVARLLVAGADVNPPGYGPLFCAVNQEWSSAAVLRELVEAGADIAAVSAAGQTVLHRIAEISSVEMIDAALELGAHLEARDAQGFTPLLTAAHNGNDSTFNRLVERGADVTARDTEGRSVGEFRSEPR